MKIKLINKASLQLGAVTSSVYLMSSVCPCCGKPTMACVAGAGGALFVGGAVVALRQAVVFLNSRKKGGQE